MTDPSPSRWRNFWGRAPSLPTATGCLLLLRVENLGLLSTLLGPAGLSQLLMQLLLHLRTMDEPSADVQIVAPGLFGITLPGRTISDAMGFALRLQDRGQGRLCIAGHQLQPVLTGVLMTDGGPDTKASAAMHAAWERLSTLPAERLGHVTLCRFQPEDPQPHLSDTVAQAAARDQILAFFQPQLCCDTGRVTGFEALARWNHPRCGLLSPASFMPAMSAADHEILLMAILRQALAALKCWDKAGRVVPTVSVNVSQCDLINPDFSSTILWELDRQDVDPARLVLEILETVGPIGTSDAARQNLKRLADAGCLLDLDDFGTGYASLDAIRQFGIHRIKIDRSFVAACDQDPAQQRMVLAILALAERLDITTLAEGVETKGEHFFLAQIGCAQVQGFAIARPMPLHDTLGFLAEQERLLAPLAPMLRKGAG